MKTLKFFKITLNIVCFFALTLNVHGQNEEAFAKFVAKLPLLKEGASYQRTEAINFSVYKPSIADSMFFHRRRYSDFGEVRDSNECVSGCFKHSSGCITIMTIGFRGDSSYTDPKLLLYNKNGTIINQLPINYPFKITKSGIIGKDTLKYDENFFYFDKDGNEKKGPINFYRYRDITFGEDDYLIKNKKGYLIFLRNPVKNQNGKNKCDYGKIIYPNGDIYVGEYYLSYSNYSETETDYIAEFGYSKGVLTKKNGEIIKGEFCDEAVICKPRIPNPTLFIGGRSMKDGTNEIRLGELKSISGIVARIENWDQDLKYKIISFSLYIFKNNMEFSSSGNLLSDDMKTALRETQNGEKLLFEDIKVKCPDGTIRNISSVIIKVK
jgi:hypothetical protein